MNIVYITQTLPFPLDNGGNIITYSTLSVLKRLGHNITIFSFIDDFGKLQFEKKINIKGLKIGKTFINPYLIQNNQNILIKFKYYCLKLFSFNPFTVSLFYDKELTTAINDYLKIEEVDCIWINYLSMSQYLPIKYNGLKILELIDIESEFYKNMFLKDSFLHWRIYAFIEWIKLHFYEKKQYCKFDKIITVSNYDKFLVKKRIKKNVIILPPKIKIQKVTKTKSTQKNLLFIGDLCWYPNKDGIYWFLKEIYPDLRKKIQNIKVNIVGELPRRNIFPKQEGVKFLGYQKNLDQFWKEAKVFIVPIRYGSGLRIKILKAMSWGLPVISTYDGAEGLEVKNGKEIILVKNEKDYINKIELLLNNKNLQKKLIENAYSFLSTYYSSAKLEKEINSIL